MTLPTELRSAVTAIKRAILQSQYRAGKLVNREQLSLYFGIGHYISEHSREGYWGIGAIERISEQLQRELPGLRGFSGTSPKKMRHFYEEWCCVFRPPVAGESSVTTNRPPSADDLIRQEDSLSRVSEIETINTSLLTMYRQPMAAKMDVEVFVGISFSHHIEILEKAKEFDESIFYIHQTYLNKWDKYKLRDLLKADLYHHQGQLPREKRCLLLANLANYTFLETYKSIGCS